MNKLDKQFEEMMKGMRIDSPTSDFTLKVMSRIQAEVAVAKRPLLHDYQPVISKRTWILLLIIFVALMIYITVSGKGTGSATGTGIWSTIFDSLNRIETKEVTTLWQKGMGVVSSIPLIAYLILTASLALWTLDGFLIRYRHRTSEIQIS